MVLRGSSAAGETKRKEGGGSVRKMAVKVWKERECIKKLVL